MNSARISPRRAEPVRLDGLVRETATVTTGSSVLDGRCRPEGFQKPHRAANGCPHPSGTKPWEPWEPCKRQIGRPQREAAGTGGNGWERDGGMTMRPIARRGLALAGLALAALVAAGCGGGGRTSGAQSGGGASGEAKSLPARSAASTPASPSFKPAPSTGNGAAAKAGSIQLVDLGNRIVRKATVDLEVGTGKLNETVSRATDVVSRHRGIYVSASTSVPDKGAARGQVTFRVPVDAFEATLDELKGLGAYRGEQSSTEDVTGQYVDQR